MSLKRAFAHLACIASLLALALPAHAVPTVSLGLSPTSIPAGGQATLYITIYDDSNNGFSAGNLVIPYPPGVTNVGGASYWDCGGSLAAGAGSGVLANTAINLPAFTSCFIYVPVTAAAGGTYTIGAPANALAASTGNSAASNTVTLTAVAPILVTNTNDSGVGSLRDAIDTANATCQPGLGISFNIPGTGPFTIQPATTLPAITCPGLVLDGYSQPGAGANTGGMYGPNDANLQVILNGSSCASCDGLTVSVSGITVRGFAIHSFDLAGIRVDAGQAYLLGNYLGTDPGGMTPLGNQYGVKVTNGYAFIGGPMPADRNLITANGTGVLSNSGAIIANSQVGGRRDGSAGMGNVGKGVFYQASNYTSQSVSTSLIIGNGAQGISVDNATLPRVLMQQNRIFGNGGIGADLGDDGPTPNDEAGPPYDTDGGPNQLMNYPVITSVQQSGGSTTINGYIKSAANSQVQVELFGNPTLPVNTEGQTPILAFSDVLDATGFLSFSKVVAGLVDNVSAQMTADTCGDGCVYSSEYSPAVAATTVMSCSIATEIASVGDGVVIAPTTIGPPGAAARLFPLCMTSPTSASWSTGYNGFFLDVTVPAAGATATYSVTVSDGSATGTFGVTLQGALAGTPVCTVSVSPALPIAPTLGNPFTLAASCSPAATSFTWSDYASGPTTYVSGQGTATANYQVGSFVEPGIGYHLQVTPTNAAGEGPTASRIIWMAQVAITAPKNMDFGTIAAGTQSAPQSVTFQNLSGTNPAYFMNVAVSGPYAVTNNCPDPLPPSASCTIDIRFAPSVAGTNQAGTASASYSFPGNPSVSIAMTGSATGAPGVMFTPSTLTFPARTVSTSSPAQTVTLSNNGTATLAISSISITGDFAFTSSCGATLAPLASCTIDVTFTPLVVGARSGVLSVADNASASPHTVALSGTGLSTAAAVLGVSPGVVDYPAQPVGSDSPPQVVTVSNSGNAPLTFTSLSISGEFRIVAPPAGATPQACPATLAPGAACRIDVVFHPLGFNLREGTLAIATNGGSVALRIMGTGLVPEPPQLEVPSSMDFGTRAVGTRSPAQPAPLHNVSPFAANVTELTASGDFAVSDTCLTIAAGATCSPSVTFQPSGTGPREGTLTVRTLRDADPYLIRLFGNGLENLEPVLELSVLQVGFGNAFVGQLVPREVTLRNVGQGVLQVSAILSGGDFFTDGACVGPIAPNASCTVRVTFNPSASGGRGAQLQVLSNAAGSPHSVTLTGTGCFLPTPSRARFGALLCGS
jgi:hypothetical protein